MAPLLTFPNPYGQAPAQGDLDDLIFFFCEECPASDR
jgi:hypothetical protein